MDHESMTTLLPRLRPSMLPALRNLAMPYSTGTILDQLRTSRLADLGLQLEAIFLSAPAKFSSPDLATYFPPGFLNRTLFDVWTYSERDFARWRLPIHHLRIRHHFRGAKIIVDYKSLERLSISIETGQLSLRSLYVPTILGQRRARTEERAQILDALKRACRRRHVKVIYESQPAECRESISKEFCRRQLELGRMEAVSQ